MHGSGLAVVGAIPSPPILNSKVHKGQLVQAWNQAHPRFHCHFLPAHCSWMNQVEQWFSIL